MLKSFLKNSFVKKIVKTFQSTTDEIKKQKEKEFTYIEKLDQELEKKYNKISSKFNFDILFILKFWLIGAAVIYISYIFFNSLQLLYLILTAYILSIAAESIIDFFQKKMPRFLAIVITYLSLIALVLSGVILIIPFIFEQSEQIIRSLLVGIQTIYNTIESHGLNYAIQTASYIPSYFKHLLLGYLKDPNNLAYLQTIVSQNISQIISFSSSYVKNAGSMAVNFVTGFFSTIFQVGVVTILAILFSIEKEGVMKFISTISGQPEYVYVKLQKLYKKLGFRLKGQLMLGFFIGSMVWILLFTLSMVSYIDMPKKFTLALIAGITEFVPILGPILGSIPALFLVFTTGYGLTGFVVIAIMYWLIQWVENNILVPVVMNHALGVSPLVVFVAMMIGANVLGFIGIILSVPIAVICSLIFEDFIK